MDFKSQYGQDKFIFEKFFSKKQEGTFVDIGAHDGITFNNTYIFEKMGWKGICVEPNIKCFELLKNNRFCICENCCIYSRDGKISFTAITGYSEMLSGITEAYDVRMSQRIESEINSMGGFKDIVELPCVRLESILNRYKINHIDYCSIDVEGSEFSVLQGINFSTTKIDIISIENNYRLTEITNFLINQDYLKIADIGVDEIYVRIGFQDR